MILLLLLLLGCPDPTAHESGRWTRIPAPPGSPPDVVCHVWRGANDFKSGAPVCIATE